MNSLILRTAVPLLVSLMVVFSIFVLFRGHSLPGGGFIGGLIAASALAVYMIASGPAAVRKALLVHPISIAGLGVLFAALSGLPSVFFGDPYLTGMWWLPDDIPIKIVATPVVFDIGVYLAVVGTVVAIALALEEWR
jgi:multicomponent Na+:H+ antiporter subunit B